MIAPSMDCSRATVCPHGSVFGVVQQPEALLLQLVRCDLDGVGVRDLELDAGLRHRRLNGPVRRAKARLRSLSQGPDAEGLVQPSMSSLCR